MVSRNIFFSLWFLFLVLFYAYGIYFGVWVFLLCTLGFVFGEVCDVGGTTSVV